MKVKTKLPVLLIFLGMATMIVMFVVFGLLSSFSEFALLVVVFGMVVLTGFYVVFLGLMMLVALSGGISTKAILVLRYQLLMVYPLVEVFFKGEEIRLWLRNQLIEVNNQLMEKCRLKISSREMMILTPHCLQASDCGRKVTGELNHCVVCGRCSIGDLLEIEKKYGVKSVIASGGTLARKAILETRPRFIIAVACERDLTSGLLDMKKLPVWALSNERPLGPCRDTQVDIVALSQVIEKFITN
ncbi:MULTISPECIES: DUF116 domain-containing protein [unclassified Fusibacter]|uniref:DUF116 domain-containing protein n=1 Tax=unclassified Fusibacter TaxID=2624464 RepID=UPI00101096FB|nr:MULTISPECIES: DUF116 domain-containing protein [unclassified Fusibacter]MCK8058053.1 DUF116 domain-containing protein [Fusibacter sp. A2]NPE20635.1 DUF116 domain-containing protein [Fusibacter sp. A1]RXV62842.1 DUF116 domain-containing protein [Fusibacter sp. A1]